MADEAGAGNKDPGFLMALAIHTDDFEVLRLGLDATEKEISDSYVLLVERYSPKGDESPEQLTSLEAVRLRLKRAYEDLMDPVRRQELVERHRSRQHRLQQRLKGRSPL
jgi:hypothetical protein